MLLRAPRLNKNMAHSCRPAESGELLVRRRPNQHHAPEPAAGSPPRRITGALPAPLPACQSFATAPHPGRRMTTLPLLLATARIVPFSLQVSGLSCPTGAGGSGSRADPIPRHAGGPACRPPRRRLRAAQSACGTRACTHSMLAAPPLRRCDSLANVANARERRRASCAAAVSGRVVAWRVVVPLCQLWHNLRRRMRQWRRPPNRRAPTAGSLAQITSCTMRWRRSPLPGRH